MNRAKSFLLSAADRFDLPADVLTGVPRMEIIGYREFTIEPHHGLVEYENDRISIDTDLGKVLVIGTDLSIKLMNRSKIAIKGEIGSIHMQEAVS